ncbi:UNVERIFIED_CONTAM: chloride channel protein, partial [Salmonella enterica subsp. enterica serovar Enteritidis]
RSYEARTNGLVLTAVILSGLAAIGLVGNYTYFGASVAVATSCSDWLLVILCGGGGGAFGAFFSAGAVKALRRIKRWTTPDPFRRTLLLAAVCGFAVALIGV